MEESIIHILLYIAGGMLSWFIIFMGKTLKERRLEKENETLMLHNEELMGLLDKKARMERGLTDDDEEYWAAI